MRRRPASTERSGRRGLPTTEDGRPALWMTGLRRRPLVSVLVLALATTAVATSVLGPLLARSVEQATLRQVLAAAEPSQSAVTVTATVGEVRSTQALLTSYDEERIRLTDLLEDSVRQTGSTSWRTPTVSITSTTGVTWRVGSGRAVTSRASSIDVGCDDWVLTVGACPARPGEVLVSTEDAQRDRVGVGTTLTAAAAGPDVGLRVVGLYDATASDHGDLVRRASLAGALAHVSGDPLVLTDEQAASMLLPAEVAGHLRLGPDVRLADEERLRQTVEAVQGVVAEQDDLLRIDTQLPYLLQRADGQMADATVLVAVTTVQGLLLALIAVSVVLQRLARSRAPEWGIGRLRGLGRTRWLASLYAEPMVLLLGGLPLGYALGVAAARAAVLIHLDPGTPVEPWRWPVWTAALATVGCSSSWRPSTTSSW